MSLSTKKTIKLENLSLFGFHGVNETEKINGQNFILNVEISFDMNSMDDNIASSISEIKKTNKKVGVSLNPETKIDTVIKHLKEIDLILIMSVNPGFGGQKFMPQVLTKIKELRKIEKENNLNFDIEIDGGINFENSKEAIEAGANILVSGTTIFKSNKSNIKKNINLLKST